MKYLLLFLKLTLRYLLKPLSFVPAVTVMVMIFYFSSQPAEESAAQSQYITRRVVTKIDSTFDMEWSDEQIAIYEIRLEHYIRKAAHMAEYFLLAFTLAVPLYVYGVRGAKLILTAGIICVLYAVSDEFHQSLVSGRGPALKDVCIDSAGALIGLLLGHFLSWLGSATLFRPLRLHRHRQVQ